MGTAAVLGYEKENGEVVTLFMRLDGYLEWTGARLLTYFNTFEQAKALVDGGNPMLLYDDHEEEEGQITHDANVVSALLQAAYERIFYVYFFEHGEWMFYGDMTYPGIPLAQALQQQ